MCEENSVLYSVELTSVVKMLRDEKHVEPVLQEIT